MINPKVAAGATGAAVTALAVWSLDTYAFRGAMPIEVVGAVQTLLPGIVAFVAGWFKKSNPVVLPQTATTTKADLMSLIDDIHNEYKKIVSVLESRFGHVVASDVNALLDQAKGQAATLVSGVETAVKADVGTVAADVAQVAAQAAPATPPAPPTTPVPPTS